MVFEVKTPVLKIATNQLLEVLEGISNSTMEHREAQVLVAASNAISRQVQTDVTTRMAMPKLAKIESAGPAAAAAG